MSQERREFEEIDPMDGTIVAPENHRVIMETEKVRVLYILIPAGHREPFHRHKYPSIMIVNNSAPLRYHRTDTKVVFIPKRDVSPQNPFVEFMESEGIHATENIGRTDYHAIRIELKHKH